MTKFFCIKGLDQLQRRSADARRVYPDADAALHAWIFAVSWPISVARVMSHLGCGRPCCWCDRRAIESRRVAGAAWRRNSAILARERIGAGIVAPGRHRDAGQSGEIGAALRRLLLEHHHRRAGAACCAGSSPRPSRMPGYGARCLRQSPLRRHLAHAQEADRGHASDLYRAALLAPDGRHGDRQQGQPASRSVSSTSSSTRPRPRPTWRQPHGRALEAGAPWRYVPARTRSLGDHRPGRQLTLRGRSRTCVLDRADQPLVLQDLRRPGSGASSYARRVRIVIMAQACSSHKGARVRESIEAARADYAPDLSLTPDCTRPRQHRRWPAQSLQAAAHARPPTATVRHHACGRRHRTHPANPRRMQNHYNASAGYASD